MSVGSSSKARVQPALIILTQKNCINHVQLFFFVVKYFLWYLAKRFFFDEYLAKRHTIIKKSGNKFSNNIKYYYIKFII